MALCRTGAAMGEAAKGGRRLKVHRRLPMLKVALAAHSAKHTAEAVVDPHRTVA